MMNLQFLAGVFYRSDNRFSLNAYLLVLPKEEKRSDHGDNSDEDHRDNTTKDC